jgi:hypothetical protein
LAPTIIASDAEHTILTLIFCRTSFKSSCPTLLTTVRLEMTNALTYNDAIQYESLSQFYIRITSFDKIKNLTNSAPTIFASKLEPTRLESSEGLHSRVIEQPCYPLLLCKWLAMTNALAYNDAVQYELLPQLYIAGCLRQTAVELQNFRCSYTISEDRLKTFFG